MARRKSIKVRQRWTAAPPPDGAHKNKNQLPDRLANDPLFVARRDAHVAFDKLWDRGPVHTRRKRRYAAYEWLAQHTGMPRSECHFSLFDVGVCEAVIDLVAQANVGLIPKPTIRPFGYTQRYDIEGDDDE